MKLINKLKDKAERVLYKHFAKKTIRKLTNVKLNKAYLEITHRRKSKDFADMAKWKVDIVFDCILKEMKARKLV